MRVLPDDDEPPVGEVVNVLVGQALRDSVAHAEPGPGFAARLAAALDELDRAAGRAAPPAGTAGGETVEQGEQAVGSPS